MGFRREAAPPSLLTPLLFIAMTVAAPSANGASTSRPAAPRTNQRPPTALELIRRDEGMPAPPPASEPLTAGFTAEQVAALAAPLDRAKVKQREQGRSRVSYLEGWQVIAEANRIFGFDGWQRQTIAVRCVAQAERLIGREQKPGWGVTYTARVRVTVAVHGGAPLIREGSGAGHGIDVDLGQAHESALKEAETDAMKRALMTFGNPFGLALYDKQQREVSSPEARPLQSAAATSPVPSAQPPLRSTAALPAAAAPADPGLAALDPSTIRQLHTTLRSLPAPLLAGFTKAFRKRFQVPEDAPSIADRISQRRHHDWIEAFLVQQMGRRSC
jgi:DNA recombination protein Rad52